MSDKPIQLEIWNAFELRKFRNQPHLFVADNRECLFVTASCPTCKAEKFVSY